jgi:hypothetical protein
MQRPLPFPRVKHEETRLAVGAVFDASAREMLRVLNCQGVAGRHRDAGTLTIGIRCADREPESDQVSLGKQRQPPDVCSTPLHSLRSMAPPRPRRRPRQPGRFR